jgi:exodeoxyribonuclease V gamma subunit
LEADKLSQLLMTQLEAVLKERQAYPNPAERVPVDWVHAQVHLQDNLGGVLSGPQGRILLSLRANKLAQVSDSGKASALPEKIIDIWLQSLAAAAMGQALECVVVGRNAVLRLSSPPQEEARVQLGVLLDTWAEGMCWPLPLPPALALQWLKDSDNFNALADLYEGGEYLRSERDKDPALARTYPNLDALLAPQALDRLAQAVYAPLQQWAKDARISVFSGVSDEGEEEASE